MIKIGLLGGTFDPPHLSHLHLAYAAIEELELDEVIFIPTWKTPLKTKASIAAPKDRLKMVEAMIQDEPKMGVSDIEITRRKISYTVDTLQELCAMQPAEYWLLMGSDAAKNFMEWKMPEKIATLCRLGVALRSTHTKLQILTALPKLIQAQIDFIQRPIMPISSTAIRETIAEGSFPNKQLNEEVIEYIKKHILYQKTLNI